MPATCLQQTQARRRRPHHQPVYLRTLWGSHRNKQRSITSKSALNKREKVPSSHLFKVIVQRNTRQIDTFYTSLLLSASAHSGLSTFLCCVDEARCFSRIINSLSQSSQADIVNSSPPSDVHFPAIPSSARPSKRGAKCTE